MPDNANHTYSPQYLYECLVRDVARRWPDERDPARAEFFRLVERNRGVDFAADLRADVVKLLEKAHKQRA